MKKITVENLDGTREEVELVNSFDVKDINRNFVILSKGEALGEGMSKVYISEAIEENSGVFKLVGITDESVWDKVKLTMKEIVRGVDTSWSLKANNVVLDSFRVIGIKDTDKEELVKAAMKQESSFVATEAVSEPMIQDQPIVEVVPEIMPEVVSESPVVLAPESEPMFINQSPEVSVQPPMPEAPAETNVFDIPLTEPTPIVNDEVQGGVQDTMSTELDKPQDFFDRVEQPSNDTVITQEMVEANRVQDSYSDDPAIIMLDNLRDVVKSKNEMIKALNEKIDVLTKQIENLEEARKVSEAQRVAAETTLAQARGVSAPNNGPTLTYQQPVNQNFNQAA